MAQGFLGPSINSGIRAGASLADLFNQRQQRAAMPGIADALGQGDYAGASQAAFRSNMPDLGLRLDPRIGRAANRWSRPMPSYDENGNLVYSQFSSDGSQRIIDGVRPLDPITYLNRGTSFQPVTKFGTTPGQTGRIVVDPRDPNSTRDLSGQPIPQGDDARFDPNAVRPGPIPIDVGGKVEAETEAKIRAEDRAQSQVDFGQTRQRANEVLDVITRLQRHPGLDSAMGFIAGRLPALTQDIQDFRNIKAQLDGQAFLQAFESLKGGGQITEIEGQRATDAIAVLRDTTSPQEFRRQLQILRIIINAGVQRASRKAQGERLTPGTNSATPTRRIRVDAQGNIIP